MSGAARKSSVVVRTFAVIGAVLLITQTIRSQMGFWAARAGAADLAYRMAPFDSDARAVKAASLLIAGNASGAISFAQAALRRSPINQMALRLLGQAHDKLKQEALADRSMQLAGRLGWRDTPLSAWLMLHGAMKGDLDLALRQADALARREQSEKTTYPVFYAAMTDPIARGILAERLSLQPTWRGAFFNGAAKLQEPQSGDFQQLLDELARRGSPPTREEVMPYIDHLVDSGLYDRGRAMWMKWGRVGAAGAATPYDPNFMTVSFNDRMDRAIAPFEWSVSSDSQDRVVADDEGGMSVAPPTDGDGNAVVSQLLTLRPGPYIIRFRLSGAPLNVVEWSLACRPDGRLIVPALSQDRNYVTGRFDIPPAGCAAQSLILRTRAQTEALRISDMRISPAQ